MKFTKELNESLENTDTSKLTAIDVLAAIIAIWGTLRVLLKLAKIFTGEEADKKIDDIIAWGDALDSMPK